MSKFFGKIREDVRETFSEHGSLYDAKVALTHKKCAEPRA